MGVSAAQIRAALGEYAAAHPDEDNDLSRLVTALDDGSRLTERGEFRGHVTCSVALADPDWRVLHVRHRTLGRWLVPGGHLEPGDTSLAAAALRELAEETGVPAGAVAGGGVIDIDVHPIPANHARGEDAHWHFDFCHLFRSSAAVPITLQEAEVTGFRWVPVGDLPTGRPEDKLRRIAQSADAPRESA
jgi:8-oxo-dGTP pyrophosphatase MutT (NUDIX family)